jgi:hypothetical protein
VSPLIEPVKSMLLGWKGMTAGEWVFPEKSGNPMQIEGFAVAANSGG